MEQVVVKTVAGMLNDRGGTLLIGVTDNGEPVGLDDDYAQVTPAERRRLRELARHTLRAQPRPRRRPPSHHPNRPDRPSGHLPHRHSSQLPPHLGKEPRTDPTSSTSAATTQHGKCRLAKLRVSSLIASATSTRASAWRARRLKRTHAAVTARSRQETDEASPRFVITEVRAKTRPS